MYVYETFNEMISLLYFLFYITLSTLIIIHSLFPSAMTYMMIDKYYYQQYNEYIWSI